MPGLNSHICGDSSRGHVRGTRTGSSTVGGGGGNPQGAKDAVSSEKNFNEILEDQHPCCQKDAASKAKGLKIRAALDKVDPSQVAERARKAAFSLGGGLSDWELPECNGLDYPALLEARKVAAAGCTEEAADRGSEMDEDDEDDDDDLDYLLDDPELLRMERVRVEGMLADAARLEALRELGFGVHLEVPDSEVEATTQGQYRGAGVVAHFYDPDSKLSASLDLLLEAKAGSYMGTRFVRCLLRADSAVASKMLVKRVPSLACYKGGVRVAIAEGMSQFGNSAEGVDPGAVDKWLVASGTLEFDPPRLDAFEGGNTNSRSGLGGLCSGEDDGDDRVEGEESGGVVRYDCGLDGCSKPFAHNHFLAAGGGALPAGFHGSL